MEIKKEYGFEDLKNECWSGALDTLETIEENEKENELMSFLESCFFGDIPTITEVNDVLWFNDEEIFDALGIQPEED